MTGIPTDPDAPTESLVSSAVGDRCVNCGAPLTSDQRYCVVCGERRGAPRFTLPAPAATVVSETTRSSGPRPPRRPRFGSGTTLVAGVATLLLAILVGVVIGHSAAGNGTKTITAGPTKIIKVGGTSAPTSGTPSASSSGSPGSSTGSSGSGSSSSGSKSSHKAKKSASSSNSTAAHTTTISKQVATQAQQAASKVTGGTNVPPPTSTVGSKCKPGSSGCSKSGKFNGSFFGQ